jgi:hypothetical protein
MEPTTADVVLFAFRDATRASQVVAAARDHASVRSVALLGHSGDCELRIVADAEPESGEARWLASALAVLDVVSPPLAEFVGSPGDAEAVSLPASERGLAAFGRLVPRGELVLMVAVCDDSCPAVGSLITPLGTALCRMPADCVIRMSTRRRGIGAPRSLAAVAHCAEPRQAG